MATKIHQRIDEISAADTVEMMIQFHIGRCHALTGSRQNQYAVDLVHPYRLVFEKQGGYTGALKAPVRCFGNHLSGKRKSQFRTDNECGGAAILKNRTSRMGTPVSC